MANELKETNETLTKEIPSRFKKTRHGLYPIDWEVRRIKDILKRVRKPVDVIPNKEYQEIGIRSHGKGIFYKEPVLGKELGNKAVFWIQPDCFVVNIVFAWEMAVAKTTKNDVGLIASHRFPMYKPLKNMLDLDYITYFFKSPRGKYLLNLASPGGAGRNKTLGQKAFGELKIVLPPNIKEQKKIADILLTWDKAVELKENLIEQKKKQKKGLMQNIFSGKVRLSGFEGEWIEKNFDDIFIKLPVTKNKIKTKEYLSSGKYPVVDQGQKKIIAYSNEKDKVLKVPDTGVIVFGDHTREIKFIDFNFVVGADGTHVLKVKDTDTYDLEFYYYYLLNKRIPNNGYSRHFKYLKEMTFIQPTIKEQKTISNILSSFDEELRLLNSELILLKQQMRGLMQRLLSGKTRVQL